MTNLNTPQTNGATNPSSPVPLDTIPISPSDGANGSMNDENTNLNGSATNKQYRADEQITVFHDPDNFNVKHPLMNHWTLWFTKPPSGKVRAQPFSSKDPLANGLREIIGMICSKRLSPLTLWKNSGAFMSVLRLPFLSLRD